MTEHGRVHPACPNASNPFHECAEYCLDKIAERAKGPKDKRGLAALSFGRRKKKANESVPVSPQLINNVQLPFAKKKTEEHYSAHKKTEEHYSVHSSSSLSPSEENNSGASSFNKKIQDSTLIVPMSGNLKSDHPNEPSKNSGTSTANGVPINPKKDKELHTSPKSHPFLDNEDAEVHKRLTSEIKSFTSLVAVQATEGSDDDADSIISESEGRVWVGKYQVKSSVKSTLEAIFDKHGDIAAKCQLESLSLRAYYLESVCFVIQEVQSTPFRYLTKSKVKEMLAILKDVEAANINVGWLRQILNRIAEALDLVGQQRVAEVTKANSDQELEKTKKMLELQTEELVQKEKEVADARAKVAETETHLNELEQKSSQLKESISSLTARVETINCKALLNEIL